MCLHDRFLVSSLNLYVKSSVPQFKTVVHRWIFSQTSKVEHYFLNSPSPCLPGKQKSKNSPNAGVHKAKLLLA